MPDRRPTPHARLGVRTCTVVLRCDGEMRLQLTMPAPHDVANVTPVSAEVRLGRHQFTNGCSPPIYGGIAGGPPDQPS